VILSKEEELKRGIKGWQRKVNDLLRNIKVGVRFRGNFTDIGFLDSQGRFKVTLAGLDLREVGSILVFLYYVLKEEERRKDEEVI